MRRHALTVILLLVAAALPVSQPKSLSGDNALSSVLAQTKRPSQRRRPTRRSKTASVDYSKFSHATKKHQGECNECHRIPTENWQKVRGFPDVVDYPDHDACVSCHRQQFFRGARPVICTNCHTVVSPRDDARLPFRNPKSLRSFTIEFPHDKHQDVIALLGPGTRDRARSVRFLKAFWSVPAADEKKTYNNCEICHGPRVRSLVAPPGGWVDGFIPVSPDAFKAAPEGHGACFNCHWKSQAPISDKCGSCHKLATAYSVADWPSRISLRFRHSREQHVAECTTCHINITKAASLRGLKPDVPITACSECHNKPPSHVEISSELDNLAKNREFVCVYCHTSDVGKRDAPLSHFLVAERPQVKRRDIK